MQFLIKFKEKIKRKQNKKQLELYNLTATFPNNKILILSLRE